MKKILAMVLVVALTAAVSIAGTMAYLTSTDSDVNVMTMGNVKIEQLEYERVVENGAWVSTNETDKYGYTPDKMQPFSQAKPLLPAVFADGKIKWDDRNGSTAEDGTGHQQSWGQVGASGTNQLFDDSVKNVQDKFVFVRNTGSSNAYVRTWIAFEQGNVTAEDFESIIGTNGNASHWSWETVATDVVIDGNEYVVCCVTYKGPKSNPTGILAPNATSYPSLLQVYMSPEATNADVAAIDGNGNGTYDILVFSQAVQAEGFTDATTALTTAFGTNHPWTAMADDNIGNSDDLEDALQNPDATTIIVNLTGDVTYDVAAWNGNAMGGTKTENIIINGNGHTITFNNTNSDWNNIVTGDAVLTINNATVTNSGHDATSGTWNGHDIVFAGKVELNNVVLENAIALMDDAKLTHVTLTDDSTGDAYGIWIRPNGQTVTIDGLKMDMTGTDGTDRGIKIDNQYSEDEDRGVTLTVKNAEIITEKKAAILVKSNANVTITTENITFSGSNTTNIVEVDSDVAANAANILHNGVAAPVEG